MWLMIWRTIYKMNRRRGRQGGTPTSRIAVLRNTSMKAIKKIIPEEIAAVNLLRNTPRSILIN